MSDPDPSLMLWEKRKRVKPVIFQVETSVKKPKTRSNPPRKAVPKPSRNENKDKKSDGEVKSKKNRGTKQDESINSEDVAKFLNKSFYEEDGSEWHATDIHFDDLAQLRSMWQLPAACHILWLLQQPLKLKVFTTLREYEAALLNPATSPVLEDVFTKLLLGNKERERLNCGLGLSYEWWSKRLEEHYDERYNKWNLLKQKASQSSSDDDDENDIDLTDEELSTLNAMTLSLAPLGNQNPLKHPANMDYIREMQEDDLRVQPIGHDRVGNQYFFYPQFYRERRIYRMSRDGSIDSWQLWAKGLDAMQAMRDSLALILKKGRRYEGEHSLMDHLDAMLELMKQERIEEQKMEDKALRRAILEAMPRKRSARIQVKTLEKLEDDKLKEEKAQAEESARAEQKRLEVLAAMEKEKELERKRMAELREQRLALKIDRETRRQKRFEQEELQLEREAMEREFLLSQQLQREHRALQRQQMTSNDDTL
ncbi:unnamed protein product [Aphanomyces euteiches]